MTIELVKILKAAKEYKHRSDMWFDIYEKSNDESDWQMSKELLSKCKAILEAYEILTGKKIYECEIEKELALC